MSNEKILVVGGAGYIGGAVTDLLAAESESFDVYDNLLYEDRYLKNVHLIHGDVRDTEKLGKIINNYGTVIWLAALVGDGACAVNPEATVQINEKAVKWLAENYKGRIIFTSTCSVYGANNDKDLTEEAPVNPLSLYAGTKVAAEKILTNHKNAAIFRLGTVYGVGDHFSRLRLDLVVNILTLRAVQGQPLTIFGGSQWRPMISVREVARMLVSAATLHPGLCGVFNLSTFNSEIIDIAHAIEKVLPGTALTYQDIKFEDQRNYHVSIDKLREAIRYIPAVDLEESIRELANLYASRRIKNFTDVVYHNQDYLKNLPEIVEWKG